MLELWQEYSVYLFPIYVLALIYAVASLLLENKNPLKTHSYLLLLLLLPVFGIIIYFFFGQNLRKQKIFNKRKLINQAFGEKYVEQHLDKRTPLEIPENYRPFNKYHKLINFLMRDLSPLTLYNKVRILKNGEQKFPAVKEAILKAKEHIHLEYYIFSDDDVGGELTELLMQKAKEGVRVRIIVDGVGSLGLKRAYFKKVRAAGIEIYEFMPVLFPSFTSKINYRNHRKIIVIDGKVGFTGGINLDDRYLNNGKHQLFWRDTHLMLEGESVKTLQFLFMLSWQFVTGKELNDGPNYFPSFKAAGTQPVQINASGPDWELASIMESFLLAFNAAEERIRITTPYFIPTESIMNALSTVTKSGVSVQLMIPYQSDSWIVQAASLSYVKQLLRLGIEVYFYTKGFVHSKVIIIDDNFASVGTSNMDYRSFDLNYEVNTYLYDKALISTLHAQFEEDMKDCQQAVLNKWMARKTPAKLKESLCRLLAPLL
mgnify:CR=1 FL=1